MNSQAEKTDVTEVREVREVTYCELSAYFISSGGTCGAFTSESADIDCTWIVWCVAQFIWEVNKFEFISGVGNQVRSY